MACGVPLVATTGGALPEVVGPDGVNALTVPPGDPSALAVAIGRVLDDPALQTRLGAAGRTHVLDRYTWAETARQTVEQYRLAIEEQRRPSDFRALGADYPRSTHESRGGARAEGQRG